MDRCDADAWLELWWENELLRRGAGNGYIAYLSHRVVDSNFTIDDSKLYGQANVTILEDWLEFCLTYELLNNGTLNISWGCPQLPAVTDPCGMNDNLPSCPTDLFGTTKSGEVEVKWNPATDDKGISYYRIYKNGSPCGLVHSSMGVFKDTNVTDGEVYTYEVHAIDSAYQEQTACKNINIKAGNSEILLLMNSSPSKNPILSWSGWDLTEYILYRGSDPQHLVEFARTSDNSLEDFNSPSGLTFYVIQQADSQ